MTYNVCYYTYMFKDRIYVMCYDCYRSLWVRIINHAGGVMVSVLATSAIYIDREFETRSDQTKDYQVGICCFSAKYAAVLWRNSKDGLARTQDNVSEWGDMSISGLLLTSIELVL